MMLWGGLRRWNVSRDSHAPQIRRHGAMKKAPRRSRRALGVSVLIWRRHFRELAAPVVTILACRSAHADLVALVLTLSMFRAVLSLNLQEELDVVASQGEFFLEPLSA